MSFDAGMLAAVISEVNREAEGFRIEKVYQPQNDEIVLLMRGREGSRRLLLRCGASDPRISFTTASRDNPASPPMLCMLLRKHLQGAVFCGAEQIGFERVAKLAFDSRDELGYPCKKYLIAEVMGKNSNLIFTDEKMKILSAMRVVDFTTSRLRQILPGMKYELPPAQEGKRDPRTETEDGFTGCFLSVPADMSAAKFINSAYLGVCPAVARQIVYRASGDISATVGQSDCKKLFDVFRSVFDDVISGRFIPVMVYDGKRPVEYSFLPLTQYGSENCRSFGSFGEMLDLYFREKDHASLVSARAADLQHAVNSSVSRLERKLDLQRAELADCARGEEYRRDADLIVANIYRLKKGDTDVRLTDYTEQSEDGSFAERSLHLDPRLTPSANAQKLYKKYNKCCTANRELTRQISIAEGELEYLLTVRDSVNRAETGADFAGIRNELEKAGYLRQKKGAAPAKSVKNTPAVYETSGGYTVLCGKNNLQNDELTFRLSERGDIWFHAKGVPGSHVLLRTGGEEPPVEDMTEAAEIAAYNSNARGGDNIPVDYSDVKNIKKPSGSRPGFVIYHTNRTAYVTPDAEKIAAMRRKD
ncbi:MAG: NFACT family protein [Clostridia bacterium]|nr:NFACT family protein [Clostridia bacterium]